MYQSSLKRFNSISFFIIVGLCAVLPFIFLTSNWGAITAVKSAVLYGAVFLASACWLIAQFVGGTFEVPKHRALMFIGVWVILALTSALASANHSVSLWGRGFSLDSWATTLVLGVFAFLVASFAREQKRLVTIFLAAFTGSVIALVLQVSFFLAKNTAFVTKYFGHIATQGTLLGSWVDFAYAAAMTFVLALMMYEVLSPKGFFRSFSLAAMVLSVIVLVFLNFKAAWIIAVVSSLLVFVYKSSVERSVSKLFPKQFDTSAESSTRFPIASFAALLISLFFVLTSASVGVRIAQRVGINFTDVRPSFTTTNHVAGATLRRDPLLGAGAGRFGEMWELYRPLEVNQTEFWNVRFESGYSMFQTMGTTNGILVVIAFLCVMAAVVIHGFTMFSYKFPDAFSRFIAVSSLIMVVSFVGLYIFFSPGIVLVVWGFMYIGLLVGVSTLVKRTTTITITYLKDPRTSFFAILLLVVATIAACGATYATGNKFASITYYNRALLATDIAVSKAHLDRAIRLSTNDVYLRTRAALAVQEFATTAQTDASNKASLQRAFSEAESYAQAAVAWDRTSATNWLGLSQVYQLIASANDNDAYSAAVQAVEQAVARSPYNPQYRYSQAEIALTKADTTSALAFIAQAIELKPNYLAAYVLRAQVRLKAGETDAPVQELMSYIKVAPYDASAYLLLGQAFTSAQQYSRALEAFKYAREINSTDPNALLGIINTYSSLGNTTEALRALDEFAQQFPNVTGVAERRAQLQSFQTPVQTTEEQKNP